MRKGIVLLIIVLLMATLVGCTNREHDRNKTENKEDDNEYEKNNLDKSRDTVNSDNSNQSDGSNDKPRHYSVWSVYWDTDNMDELARIKENVEAISYFAAYFDKEKLPFIPEETMESYQNIKNIYDNQYKSYLTIVNDLIKEDGTSSLKDTDLLYELLGTKDGRKEHINTILSLVLDNGFDGIEIDYEAIKKDENLWGYFNLFLEELYQSATNQNILVRVLFEPNIPIDNIELPKGPDYVMMCYNLHGYGTKPGPKANEEFLMKMIDKMKDVPGKAYFAIATGGFDYSDTGSVQQVTEEVALMRMNEYEVQSSRDLDSQSLVYTYTDKDGVRHEVWYADHTTIDYWFQIIEEAGDYGLSLWRMGGNSSIMPIE